MNGTDPEQFEAALHQLRPAKAPEDFVARLAAAVPEPTGPSHPRPQPCVQTLIWPFWLRWLGPVAAVLVVSAALFVGWPGKPAGRQQAKAVTVPAPASTPSDDVEIDRQLVAVFDAIARLPNGEQVRFRCRQWNDEVVLRTPGAGLVIEQEIPQLEIVPVRFETY